MADLAVWVTVFAVGSTNLSLGRLSVWYGFHTEFSNAPAPLAQSVEHRTFNPLVEGSSPSGRTHPSGQIGLGVVRNLLEVPIGVGEVSEVEKLRPFEVTDPTIDDADFGLY